MVRDIAFRCNAAAWLKAHLCGTGSHGCQVWRLGFPGGKSGELLLIANYACLTLEEVADSGMQLMAMFFQQ
jgi:hypothetical protein